MDFKLLHFLWLQGYKRFKEGQTAVPDAVATMDTGIKLTSLTTISVKDFIMNNVKPVVYLEKDVFDTDYVIYDDAFFSKFSAITSNFAYLFDVYSDGTLYTFYHIMSISYLNSIHTEPFNISDIESTRELQLAKKSFFEEKSELERIIKK